MLLFCYGSKEITTTAINPHVYCFNHVVVRRWTAGPGEHLLAPVNSCLALFRPRAMGTSTMPRPAAVLPLFRVAVEQCSTS